MPDMPMSARRILHAVCHDYGITMDELTTMMRAGRRRSITPGVRERHDLIMDAKSAAAKRLRSMTLITGARPSLRQIATWLGYKGDHASTCNAVYLLKYRDRYIATGTRKAA